MRFERIGKTGLAGWLVLAMGVGLGAAGEVSQGNSMHKISLMPYAGATFQRSWVINFGDVPAVNSTAYLRYKTFTNPRNGDVVRYLDMKHFKISSVGACSEIKFSSMSNGPDWTIWANIGTASAPNWTTAADDNNGMAPTLRIWLKGSFDDGTTRLRLSPYWASLNSSNQHIHITELADPSEANCLAQTPAVKISGSTVTLYNPH